ncbi:uncharacterized protein BDZ99DRAFT_567532 [Mytilinidion resinicola]|uniref:Uncharacterized protein n=1 Tax=Mytilinidion resinicola TaxID=574789 RepID=A0A6A6Z0V6_9PEZI|nr:uncharacterized protein BDZ99DRAFT_567532 [Mytilinidion resinicola]KAF2813795.1 hypothetical protein BDZ99DRAFT_567532 [Mytilinidion resinicola]
MGRSRPRVNEWFEALGWRHFGKDEGVVKRPKFNFKPLNDLYKTEIGNLFTKLSTSAVDRDDPKLFDKEFDKILEKLGPPIWPNKPANVQRAHLRDPDPETLYKKHLIYPRDKATIKEHLRQLVLAKRSRGTAATANINRSALRDRANDDESESTPSINKSVLRSGASAQNKRQQEEDHSPSTPNITKAVLRGGAGDTRGVKKAKPVNNATSSKRKRPQEAVPDDEAELEEPHLSPKRQRTSGQKEHASQAKGKQKQVYPTGGADVFEQTKINLFSNHTPHGSITLQGCKSAAQLLERVADVTKGSNQGDAGADVAYLKIYLSEDMSTEPWVRIDNNRHQEGKFNHLKRIITDAPLFPGTHEALLEAEVGF